MKKYIVNRYGQKIESLGSFENIKFEDLINERIEYKKIVLLLGKGISPFLKKQLQSNDLTIIRERYTPSIETFFNITNPINIYLDRAKQDKLGVIELNVADIATSLFKNYIDINEKRFASEYNLEDIRQESAEVAYVNTELRDILMSEIKNIIKTIEKYENVTDILIDVTVNSIIRLNDDIDPSESYSISELAKLWSMTDANIRMAIKNGKFDNSKIEKVGKTWIIPYSEMDNVFGDFALNNINKTIKQLGYAKSISMKDKNEAHQKGEYLASLYNGYFFNYIKFKKLIVEGIQNRSLESIKSVIKDQVKVFKKDEIYNSIISEDDFAKMLLILKKSFLCKNNELLENSEIIKTYIVYENNLDTLYKDTVMNDAGLRFAKDFSFKIYGQTKEDLESDSRGVEIGSAYVSHYNIQYLDNIGQYDELWFVMDDKSQLAADIYNLLYNKCIEKDYIGINSNILCIEDINICDTYCSKKVIEDFIKNISSDLELLFNLESGVILAPVVNDNKDIYYKCYKELGFSFEEYNGWNIAVFNNDYIMGAVSVDDNQDTTANITTETINGIEFEVEFQGCHNIKSWKATINHQQVVLKKIEDKYWCFEIIHPYKGILSVPPITLVNVSSKEDVFREAMKYVSMNEGEDNPCREPSKIKVKVKCIKDYMSDDKIIFEKDNLYRAVDNGYKLSLNKDYVNYIIAQNNYGKWEEDENFKEYFCLVKTN